MEYYSALAKRRRLEKQAVVAAPSSQITRKSSRLLTDAKFKCDEPSSITTTHKDKNDSSRERAYTSSKRGKKRVSISGEIEVLRTIDDSDDYDSDEELGDYIYKHSRTAQYFREERKLASAPSAALRKSPRLSLAAVKSHDTEVKQQRTKYPIGTRMAKEFFIEDRKVTELCYGSITRYNSDDNSHFVLYDDGDKEDISEDEIAILVNNATRISTKTFTNTKKRTTKLNRNPIVASSSDAVTIATRRVVCRNGRFRTICSTAGCINLAVNGGVCVSHGAQRKKCSYEGCKNKVINSGVCCRHGAKMKICNMKGCNNYANRGRVCARHGAKKKPCSYEGCTNQSKVNGVCSKHGAKRKICNHVGCTNQAQSKGVCFRHGAPRKVCTHEGCNTLAYQIGLCCRHGAKRKPCSYEGCTKQAQNMGVCTQHGAKRRTCSHEGCNHHAKSKGVCTRHGANKRKLCSHEGCSSQAVVGGVCYSHGAPRKICNFKGCTNRAVSSGVCCTHGAKGLAVIKDAIMRLLIQVYVVGMAHRRKHAAMKDVPIIQKEMECAEGMVHISEGVLSIILYMD